MKNEVTISDDGLYATEGTSMENMLNKQWHLISLFSLYVFLTAPSLLSRYNSLNAILFLFSIIIIIRYIFKSNIFFNTECKYYIFLLQANIIIFWYMMSYFPFIYLLKYNVFDIIPLIINIITMVLIIRELILSKLIRKKLYWVLIFIIPSIISFIFTVKLPFNWLIFVLFSIPAWKVIKKEKRNYMKFLMISLYFLLFSIMLSQNPSRLLFDVYYSRLYRTSYHFDPGILSFRSGDPEFSPELNIGNLFIKIPYSILIFISSIAFIKCFFKKNYEVSEKYKNFYLLLIFALDTEIIMTTIVVLFLILRIYIPKLKYFTNRYYIYRILQIILAFLLVSSKTSLPWLFESTDFLEIISLCPRYVTVISIVITYMFFGAYCKENIMKIEGNNV